MQKIRFSAQGGFHETLQKRARQYFAANQLPKTGDWRMFLKTGICLTWLATAYVLLVFFAASLTSALLTAFALAQGFILVSCNIMHDGAHDSFSKNKKISWLMGCTLDLMGGSQLLWRQKHNVLHHTYTNINALDSDLHTSALLRLHPEQPWRAWHRLQHVYAFPLYSFLTLSWVIFSDFRKFFSGHIGPYRLRQCTVLDVCQFFLTKLFYCGYALILPLFFHPFLHVLIAFVAVHLLLGFTLSIVFQLAHTMESNTFPTPDPHTGTVDNAWAMHEVETTANFAPYNTLLTWYVGGLNFQIEHHLFSRICHIHYPAISTIVRETCQEFSLPYVCYPTLRSAIAAHYRFLKTMGRRPAEAGGPLKRNEMHTIYPTKMVHRLLHPDRPGAVTDADCVLRTPERGPVLLRCQDAAEGGQGRRPPPGGVHHNRTPDNRQVGGTPAAGENRG